MNSRELEKVEMAEGQLSFLCGEWREGENRRKKEEMEKAKRSRRVVVVGGGEKARGDKEDEANQNVDK